MTHLHPGILRKFSLTRERAGGGAPSDGAMSQALVRELGALGSPEYLVKVQIPGPSLVCRLRISGVGGWVRGRWPQAWPGNSCATKVRRPPCCLDQSKDSLVSQALEDEALVSSFSPNL